MEYNNAVFVENQYSAKIHTQTDIKTAFNEGYLDKADRKSLFPWNEDTEFLLMDAPTEQKISQVTMLFSQYEGKYIISEAPWKNGLQSKVAYFAQILGFM